MASGASLRQQLARVGVEKERARAERMGPPAPGALLARINQCLRLYQDGLELRRAHLLSELPDEKAVRLKLEAERLVRQQEQEQMLMRIQRRLYGAPR